MDLQQAIEKVDAIASVMDKVKGETQALLEMVADLQQQVADAQSTGTAIPQALVDKLNALYTKVGEVDGMVSDDGVVRQPGLVPGPTPIPPVQP